MLFLIFILLFLVWLLLLLLSLASSRRDAVSSHSFDSQDFKSSVSSPRTFAFVRFKMPFGSSKGPLEANISQGLGPFLSDLTFENWPCRTMQHDATRYAMPCRATLRHAMMCRQSQRRRQSQRQSQAQAQGTENGDGDRARDREVRGRARRARAVDAGQRQGRRPAR